MANNLKKLAVQHTCFFLEIRNCIRIYAISVVIILPNVSPSGCMQFCQRSTGQKNMLDEGLFYWVYGQLDGNFMLLLLGKKAKFCPFYFWMIFCKSS